MIGLYHAEAAGSLPRPGCPTGKLHTWRRMLTVGRFAHARPGQGAGNTCPGA
jgi:hypothetical protein